MKPYCETLNVEILRQVQEVIRTRPLQVEMSDWLTRNPKKIPECGTAGCIAAWIVCLHHHKNPEQIRQDFKGSIWNAAADILRAEDIEDTGPLFFRRRWPAKFLPVTPDSLIARIDYFIETGF